MTTKKKNSPNNFRKQSKNANKHTERGLDLLDKSMLASGWGAKAAPSRSPRNTSPSPSSVWRIWGSNRNSSNPNS